MSSSAILPCGPFENTVTLFCPMVMQYFGRDDGSGPRGNMVTTCDANSRAQSNITIIIEIWHGDAAASTRIRNKLAKLSQLLTCPE